MNKLKYQYVIYLYTNKYTDENLYIGIAKGDGLERHQNHLKPSKKYDHGGEESFNAWLQDNGDKWEYHILGELFARDYEDAKAMAQASETYYINMYQPKYNQLKVKYLKELE